MAESTAAESSTAQILNRILVLHHRSLPTYLHFAPPWRLSMQPQVQEVLKHIAADHERTVDRLGPMILESGSAVDYGCFPMTFTGMHDLSVEYVVKTLIDRQKRLISALEKIADELALAPFAQAVAKEIVGEAKGHLDNLLEAAGQGVATSA